MMAVADMTRPSTAKRLLAFDPERQKWCSAPGWRVGGASDIVLNDRRLLERWESGVGMKMGLPLRCKSGLSAVTRKG